MFRIQVQIISPRILNYIQGEKFLLEIQKIDK